MKWKHVFLIILLANQSLSVHARVFRASSGSKNGRHKHKKVISSVIALLFTGGSALALWYCWPMVLKAVRFGKLNGDTSKSNTSDKLNEDVDPPKVVPEPSGQPLPENLEKKELLSTDSIGDQLKQDQVPENLKKEQPSNPSNQSTGLGNTQPKGPPPPPPPPPLFKTLEQSKEEARKKTEQLIGNIKKRQENGSAQIREGTPQPLDMSNIGQQAALKAKKRNSTNIDLQLNQKKQEKGKEQTPDYRSSLKKSALAPKKTSHAPRHKSVQLPTPASSPTNVNRRSTPPNTHKTSEN